jgi:hypothetical protein
MALKRSECALVALAVLFASGENAPAAEGDHEEPGRPVASESPGPAFAALNDQCSATYSMKAQKGVLGARAAKLEPHHVYLRYDSFRNRIVHVAADDKGVLDPRPLGGGTVLPCAWLSEPPPGDGSDFCRLSEDPEGSFERLPADSSLAGQIVTFKATPKVETKGKEKVVWQYERNEPIRAPGSLALRGPSRKSEGEVIDVAQGLSSDRRVPVKGPDGRTYQLRPGEELARWAPTGELRVVPRGHELIRVLSAGRWEFKAIPRGRRR